MTSALPQSLFADELGNAVRDEVADAAHAGEVLVGGIGQRPVVAGDAGHDGALLSAAHGDERVGLSSEFVGEFLRAGVREVDADLAHSFNDHRMDAFGGLRSGGDGAGAAAIGGAVEESGRHLRAAGGVDAGEEEEAHEGSVERLAYSV